MKNRDSQIRRWRILLETLLSGLIGLIALAMFALGYAFQLSGGWH